MTKSNDFHSKMSKGIVKPVYNNKNTSILLINIVIIIIIIVIVIM